MPTSTSPCGSTKINGLTTSFVDWTPLNTLLANYRGNRNGASSTRFCPRRLALMFVLTLVWADSPALRPLYPKPVGEQVVPAADPCSKAMTPAVAPCFSLCGMLTIALGIVLGVVIVCLIPPLLTGVFCAVLNVMDKGAKDMSAPSKELPPIWPRHKSWLPCSGFGLRARLTFTSSPSTSGSGPQGRQIVGSLTARQ